jgi:Rod binding domain-containing protein
VNTQGLGVGQMIASAEAARETTLLKAASQLSPEVLKKRSEAEKVAEEFETMFMDMMVKSMRKTSQPEDVSNAEDIYQGMLDSEYAKSMTATQSFGIKSQILQWLEQTDPLLKVNPSERTESNNKSELSESRKDTFQLQNDALALKAANHAYRLNALPSGTR